MSKESRGYAMLTLLADLFPGGAQLRPFLDRFVEKGASDALPGPGAPPRELFDETAQWLQRRGWTQDQNLPRLLSDLGSVKPRQWERILAFARAQGLGTLPTPARQYLRDVSGDTGAVRRVFISYSREDGAWARATAAALRHADVGVFLDVDVLREGEDFMDRVAEEMDRVDRVILGWSRSSAASRYVKLEYQQALRIRNEEGVPRFLAVERLDSTPLPPELEGVLGVDSTFSSPATGWEELQLLDKEDRVAVLRLVRSLAAGRRGARGSEGS